MNPMERIKKLRDQGKTYEEIGKILGVSRQRAHQILPGYCNPMLRRLELNEKIRALAFYKRYLREKEKQRKFLSSAEGQKQLKEKLIKEAKCRIFHRKRKNILKFKNSMEGKKVIEKIKKDRQRARWQLKKIGLSQAKLHWTSTFESSSRGLSFPKLPK